MPFPRHPQQQHEREDADHDQLAARQWPHGFEALRSQRLCDFGLLRLRWTQPVNDIRYEHEPHDSRHARRQCPRRPRHRNARALARELRDQRVRRGGGEEHGRHDEIALIQRFHQEGSHPTGSCSGFGPARARNVERDRKEDASRPRRVRRRHRCNHQIRQHDGVAESKRACADAVDDPVCDSLAEASLHETAREQEGCDDEPHGDVRKAGERIRHREEAQHRSRRDRDENQRAIGQRLGNQSADGRGKETQQGPPFRVETGVRAQPDCRGERERHEPTPVAGGHGRMRSNHVRRATCNVRRADNSMNWCPGAVPVVRIARR